MKFDTHSHQTDQTPTNAPMIKSTFAHANTSVRTQLRIAKPPKPSTNNNTNKGVKSICCECCYIMVLSSWVQGVSWRPSITVRDSTQEQRATE